MGPYRTIFIIYKYTGILLMQFVRTLDTTILTSWDNTEVILVGTADAENGQGIGNPLSYIICIAHHLFTCDINE
jgi:hypothetical protein